MLPSLLIILFIEPADHFLKDGSHRVIIQRGQAFAAPLIYHGLGA